MTGSTSSPDPNSRSTMRTGSHERPPPAFCSVSSTSMERPEVLGCRGYLSPSYAKVTGAAASSASPDSSFCRASSARRRPMSTPATVVPLGTRSPVMNQPATYKAANKVASSPNTHHHPRRRREDPLGDVRSAGSSDLPVMSATETAPPAGPGTSVAMSRPRIVASVMPAVIKAATTRAPQGAGPLAPWGTCVCCLPLTPSATR